MVGGSRVSRLRKAALKIGIPCASFTSSMRLSSSSPREDDTSVDKISNSGISSREEGNAAESPEDRESSGLSKNLCAICLEPLNCNSNTGGTSSAQAIFTAQCSHAFHFVCISSNVRHGNVTCPICRAYWTQLPRNLTPPCPPPCPRTDPILQILDDSIATFRVHRRSTLRSARYDDDDPVESDVTPPGHPRLCLTLIPVPLTQPSYPPPCNHPALQAGRSISHHVDGVSPRRPSPLRQYTSSSSISQQNNTSPNDQKPCICTNRAYLSVKLAHQQATDLVLVASTNGPHLRLLKQSMALVVFSLRSVDRLAIVTYSSAATRVFPLRRMSSHGKRTALQVIDRLFYLGEADPSEGLKKGMKILEDRNHHNPQCCILHLSDSPTRASYISREMQFPVPIHCFHVGFGFGTSNGFVMHEFEEFLIRLLGGVVREAQLRIGEEGVVRLGELRSGEERRIPLGMGDCGFVCVGYSYIEGGLDDECLKTGEMIVGIADKGQRDDDGEIGNNRDLSIGGRSSNVERWDYHDPYMARRWAKHLHGYRL
ncbi:hypothetical protein ACLOJK_015381 [Asimina triloba]